MEVAGLEIDAPYISTPESGSTGLLREALRLLMFSYLAMSGTDVRFFESYLI